MPAAAAPTAMRQAVPRSCIVGAHSTGMPAASHSAAIGSVIPGSAFFARNTRRTLPFDSAFRSCFTPTTFFAVFSSFSNVAPPKNTQNGKRTPRLPTQSWIISAFNKCVNENLVKLSKNFPVRKMCENTDIQPACFGRLNVKIRAFQKITTAECSGILS